MCGLHGPEVGFAASGSVLVLVGALALVLLGVALVCAWFVARSIRAPRAAREPAAAQKRTENETPRS